MDFAERRSGTAIVLAPIGRIDLLTADQFRDRLMPLVGKAGESGGSVVIDFSQVDYISSAGLRVLMAAAKQTRSSGGKVAIAALQPVVREIYQISHFDKVVPCYPAVDDALEAVGGKG